MNCNHRRLNIALYCGSIYKNINNRENIKNKHPWHMIVCSQGVFLTTKQQGIIIYSVMYSKTDDHRLYACHTFLTLISMTYFQNLLAQGEGGKTSLPSKIPFFNSFCIFLIPLFETSGFVILPISGNWSWSKVNQMFGLGGWLWPPTPCLLGARGLSVTI